MATRRDKSVTLYDLIFPLWVLPFFPTLIIPFFLINLLVDGALIWLYLKWGGKTNQPGDNREEKGRESLLANERPKESFWAYTLKAALWGYVADFLGAGALMLIMETPFYPHYFDVYQVWTNPVSVALHLTAILMTGLFIYLFHRHRGRKLGLNNREARNLGLLMGIFTAPWLYLLPTSWFFH